MACSRYFVRRVERGKGEQEFGVGKDGGLTRQSAQGACGMEEFKLRHEPS